MRGKFASVVVALCILGATSACTRGGISRIADTPASPTPSLTVTPLPTSTSLSTPIPCPKQFAEFLQQDILKQFEDTNTLASKTPRVALTEPVGRLQEARRQLDKLQTNDCTWPLKLYWGRYMDGIIEGYLAFMGQASEAEVSVQFEKAKSWRADLAVITDIVSSSAQPPTMLKVKYKAEAKDRLDVEYLTLRGTQYINSGRTWEDTHLFFGGREPELKVKNGGGYTEGTFCELWVDDQLLDRQTITEAGGIAVCRRRPN